MLSLSARRSYRGEGPAQLCERRCTTEGRRCFCACAASRGEKAQACESCFSLVRSRSRSQPTRGNSIGRAKSNMSISSPRAGQPKQRIRSQLGNRLSLVQLASPPRPAVHSPFAPFARDATRLSLTRRAAALNLGPDCWMILQNRVFKLWLKRIGRNGRREEGDRRMKCGCGVGRRDGLG